MVTVKVEYGQVGEATERVGQTREAESGQVKRTLSLAECDLDSAFRYQVSALRRIGHDAGGFPRNSGTL